MNELTSRHTCPPMATRYERVSEYTPSKKKQKLVIKLNKHRHFHKNKFETMSFVTWRVILPDVAMRRWLHCGHKGMDVVSCSIQVDCGV